jgi:hypothetical protein
MKKLREKLPYGYKAYTGKVLQDCTIDSYNYMQEEINSYIKAGRPVPVEALNRSAFLFTTGAAIF